MAAHLREAAQQIQLAAQSEVASGPGEGSGEALKRVQHTAMLIDGVGWSQPGPPARSGSETTLDSLPASAQAPPGLPPAMKTTLPLHGTHFPALCRYFRNMMAIGGCEGIG